jgi:hypothetical protein
VDSSPRSKWGRAALYNDDGFSIAPIEWPDPVDLFREVGRGAPVLGQHHVPDALWPFVTDTAELMGVDPSGVAMCAIVSCASVITDDWSVQPKRFDYTWTENARLWGAIVGDPSVLKTPIINVCTQPIVKLEIGARKTHKAEMLEWEQKAAAAKQDKIAPPKPPRCDRFMVESATIEALTEVLRDDAEAKMRTPCKKVLSRQDEMSEFFGNLDRHNSGKGGGDRGSYLRLYNGGRHTTDRVGRGNFAVEHWSACFLGGIQPGPIQKIAKDSDEDGLLQRFMFNVAEAQSRGVDRAPNHGASLRYGELFPALVGLRPSVPIGSDRIKPVVFHADAHAHREAIDALADTFMRMPDTSLRLKATLGKWSALFARLCLTFHLIEHADLRARSLQAPVISVITEATAAMVAAYMRDIVLPHRLRAEEVMYSTAQTSHAKWIAGYILSRNCEKISRSDILRDYRALSAPENRQQLDTVMASLTAVSWLEPEEPANPAKGITWWRVNPRVHTTFAERAKAEPEARAKIKAEIAATVAERREARQSSDDAAF